MHFDCSTIQIRLTRVCISSYRRLNVKVDMTLDAKENGPESGRLLSGFSTSHPMPTNELRICTLESIRREREKQTPEYLRAVMFGTLKGRVTQECVAKSLFSLKFIFCPTMKCSFEHCSVMRCQPQI